MWPLTTKRVGFDDLQNFFSIFFQNSPAIPILFRYSCSYNCSIRFTPALIANRGTRYIVQKTPIILSHIDTIFLATTTEQKKQPLGTNTGAFITYTSH
jgi:hypothetical protein